MEKITDIIESIANERGLEIDAIREKIKDAFKNTAKKLFGDKYEYETEIDPFTKDIKLFQKIQVIPDDEILLDENEEEIPDSEQFIRLSDAKKIDNSVEVGDELRYEINLENLGRTASETLSRELNYHIQKLEEEKIYEKYMGKVGKLVFGNVTRVDDDETTHIEIDDKKNVYSKTYMPRRNRIKGEVFHANDTVRAVVRRVFMDKTQGIKIELSRTSPKFLEALLKSEVPEIKDESVIIHSSARIPGERAKVAVYTISANIDPVGATVGTKGIRINAVSKELNNENIDVIEYSNQPEIFISRAMSPAIVNSVKINDKKATIYINSEQKSKAIGKSGLNIRLASMLTGYQIELVETGTHSETNLSENGKSLENLFRNL